MTLQHDVHVAMPDMAEVLALVAEERARQLEKWGPQRHRDIEPSMATHYVEQETQLKLLNDYKARKGSPSWDTILLEEVYEAFTAGTVEDRIKELTEVAAVAVAWIEDLQSREGRNG
jgi:hypothetical protein